MMDFTSQFWIYLILVLTVISLAFVIYFAFINRHTTSGVNETTGHVWDEDLTEYDNPLPAWWLYLLYLTVIFSAVYLVLYPGMLPNGGILNWTQIGQYEEEISAANASYATTFKTYDQMTPVELAKNPEAMKTAARLFSQNCALCHGADARGTPGIPNLRDDDWIYGNSPGMILHSILEGRMGIMPGWGPVLGGREASEDVANYVLSLSGEVVNAESAKRGQTQYKTVCAACHGLNGEGNPMLGGMNLSDRLWLHGSTFEEIADIIENGVTNQMPAHKDILGEAKSKLLAGYVISFFN